MGFFGSLGIVFYTVFIALLAILIYDRRNKCTGRDLDRVRLYVQPGLDFFKPQENVRQ